MTAQRYQAILIGFVPARGARALGYAQKISVLEYIWCMARCWPLRSGSAAASSGACWRSRRRCTFWARCCARAINRPRPYEALNFTPLFPKDTKGQSMPSRHCFSAAAIVAAAFTVWVPLGVAACLLAAVVAVTRVLTGVALPQRRTGWPGLWHRGGCDGFLL